MWIRLQSTPRRGNGEENDDFPAKYKPNTMCGQHAPHRWQYRTMLTATFVDRTSFVTRSTQKIDQRLHAGLRVYFKLDHHRNHCNVHRADHASRNNGRKLMGENTMTERLRTSCDNDNVISRQRRMQLSEIRSSTTKTLSPVLKASDEQLESTFIWGRCTVCVCFVRLLISWTVRLAVSLHLILLPIEPYCENWLHVALPLTVKNTKQTNTPRQDNVQNNVSWSGQCVRKSVLLVLVKRRPSKHTRVLHLWTADDATSWVSAQFMNCCHVMSLSMSPP